jgi:putative addiction module component (TIGR02574 family)
MINLQEILQLSTAERILMMEKIWESIEHDNLETTPFQKDELDRRLERFKEGHTKFFSWEDVKKDIRSAIRNESTGSI